MTTPTARAAGSGKITRDAVLAAAPEIIDRDGTDALSMRRLARALDRDPMTLYRHAPGKAALLDGVAVWEELQAAATVMGLDRDDRGHGASVRRIKEHLKRSACGFTGRSEPGSTTQPPG